MPKILETIRGKLPPPRDPNARALAESPPSGGGTHHTRVKDVAKGRSRKEKHRKDPREEACASRVASLYVEASRGDVSHWRDLAPSADARDLGALEEYARHEGIDVSSPSGALKEIVWGLGYAGEALPATKTHWIWRLAKALAVDVKRDHAKGAKDRVAYG